MDLIGPLPGTTSGYAHMLVITDYFSKFSMLFPLRTATAQIVVRHVEESIFLLFGAPQYINCDNGVQFKGHHFQKLCEEYRVMILFNAAYHPQAKSTERTNEVVKTMLASYIRGNHRNWDNFLQRVGCAIRTSVAQVTKLSPQFVNFGREHIPYGDMHRKPDFAGLAEARPVRSPVAFQRMFQDVQKRLKIAHDWAKHRYDLRRRPVQYRVGDQVWNKNYALSDASKYFSAKLAPKYEGPFVIKQQLSPLTFQLKDGRGLSRGV